MVSSDHSKIWSQSLQSLPFSPGKTQNLFQDPLGAVWLASGTSLCSSTTASSLLPPWALMLLKHSSMCPPCSSFLFLLVTIFVLVVYILHDNVFSIKNRIFFFFPFCSLPSPASRFPLYCCLSSVGEMQTYRMKFKLFVMVFGLLHNAQFLSLGHYCLYTHRNPSYTQLYHGYVFVPMAVKVGCAEKLFPHFYLLKSIPYL